MYAIRQRSGRYPGLPVRPFGSWALTFGGVDEFVDLTGTQVGPDVAWSIAIWVRVPATAVAVGLWAEHSAGTGRRYLEVQADGTFFYAVLANDGSTAIALTAATSGRDDGNWHHVVVTERGDRLVTLYVDGVRDAVTPANYDGTAVTVTAASLGRRPGGGGAFSNFLTGDIAHLATWSRELSNTDAASLYNNGISWDWRLLGSGGPVHNYQCGEDDTFPSLTDRGSGPAVTGTMTNMESADIARGGP